MSTNPQMNPPPPFFPKKQGSMERLEAVKDNNAD
jgi:hypothetical protein